MRHRNLCCMFDLACLSPGMRVLVRVALSSLSVVRDVIIAEKKKNAAENFCI